MEEKKRRDEKAVREEQEMRMMTKMLLHLGMAEMVVDLNLLKDPPKGEEGSGKK